MSQEEVMQVWDDRRQEGSIPRADPQP
jgi:hypothetical protein